MAHQLPPGRYPFAPMQTAIVAYLTQNQAQNPALIDIFNIGFNL